MILLSGCAPNPLPSLQLLSAKPIQEQQTCCQLPTFPLCSHKQHMLEKQVAASPECLSVGLAEVYLSMYELGFHSCCDFYIYYEVLKGNTLKCNTQFPATTPYFFKHSVFKSVSFKYNNPIIIFLKQQPLRIPLTLVSTLKALIMISAAMILFQYT